MSGWPTQIERMFNLHPMLIALAFLCLLGNAIALIAVLVLLTM